MLSAPHATGAFFSLLNPPINRAFHGLFPKYTRIIALRGFVVMHFSVEETIPMLHHARLT